MQKNGERQKHKRVFHSDDVSEKRRQSTIRAQPIKETVSCDRMQCQCAALSAQLSLPIRREPFADETGQTTESLRRFPGAEEPDPRVLHLRLNRVAQLPESESMPNWIEELVPLSRFEKLFVDPSSSNALRPTVIDESLARGRLLRQSRRHNDLNPNNMNASPRSTRTQTASNHKYALRPFIHRPAFPYVIPRQFVFSLKTRGLNTIPQDPSGRRITTKRSASRQLSMSTFEATCKQQQLQSSSLLEASESRPVESESRSLENLPPPLPPPSQRIRIRILESHVGFSDDLNFKEEDSVLHYEARTFEWRLRLQVEALDTTGRWLIGFVQGCVANHNENEYGASGSTWWELHELSHGRRRIVNDSDGEFSPWMHADMGAGLVEIESPLGAAHREGQLFIDRRDLKTAEKAQLGKPFALRMSDSPDSNVPWSAPIFSSSCGLKKPQQSHDLTAVRRSQRFLVWLALYDIERRTYFGLKAVTWGLLLELKVDTSRPLNCRVNSVRNETSFEVLEDTDCHSFVRLPADVLMPPFANACQSLVWRPRHIDNCEHKTKAAGRRPSEKIAACNCNMQPILIVEPKQYLSKWSIWKKEMLQVRQKGPIKSTKSVADCPFIVKLQ